MSSLSRLRGQLILAKSTKVSPFSEISAGYPWEERNKILQARAQSDGIVATAIEIAGSGRGIKEPNPLSKSFIEDYIWVSPIRNPRLRGLQHDRWAPETNRFGDAVRKEDDGTPRAHQGIDIFAPVGSPVYSVRKGQVVTIGYSDGIGFGIYVMVKFKTITGETYYAFYGHLSEVNVALGANVAAGALIGKSGTTGLPSSIRIRPQEHHLHFGISKIPKPSQGTKNWVDPEHFLKIEVQNKPSVGPVKKP